MTIEIVYNKREYKYTKGCYLKIKDKIKELSAEQRILKPQRKEDWNLKVPRTHTTYSAIYYSKKNKYNLRYLFIIYDEARGKIDRVKLEESKLSNIYQKNSLQKLKDEYLMELKS